MAQGVGLNLLHAGCQHLRGPPASPTDMGRVEVVEPLLPLSPVGQRQLRGEKGLVPPRRRQDHRNEHRPCRQPEASLPRFPAAVIDEGACSCLGEGKQHFTGTPVIVGQTQPPHKGARPLIGVTARSGGGALAPGGGLLSPRLDLLEPVAFPKPQLKASGSLPSSPSSRRVRRLPSRSSSVKSDGSSGSGLLHVRPVLPPAPTTH